LLVSIAVFLVITSGTAAPSQLTSCAEAVARFSRFPRASWAGSAGAASEETDPTKPEASGISAEGEGCGVPVFVFGGIRGGTFGLGIVAGFLEKKSNVS
jgi:hypothetical protein